METSVKISKITITPAQRNHAREDEADDVEYVDLRIYHL